MQGTHFLIKDANNLPINHGVILREITPTKYLCDFARVPTVMRICDITLLEKWSLFRDDETMNRYILALTPVSTPPAPVPLKPEKLVPGSPEFALAEVAAIRKKDAKKKVTKKTISSKKRTVKKKVAKKKVTKKSTRGKPHAKK